MYTFFSSYSTKTAIKIPVKVRNLVIDRYFDKFKELPFSMVNVIDRKDNNKKDFLVLCESANNSAVICYREQFNEVFMYDIAQENSITF